MFGKLGDGAGSGPHSVIQEGVSVQGRIEADGEIRIDGRLEGSLQCKSRVTVGVSGSVQADIEGSEILVMGRVLGNLIASRRIDLRKGAHVEGDLSSQSLVIEEGVFFQGRSQMLLDPGPAKGATSENPVSMQPVESAEGEIDLERASWKR